MAKETKKPKKRREKAPPSVVLVHLSLPLEEYRK
jgi:hypothetical protein